MFSVLQNTTFKNILQSEVLTLLRFFYGSKNIIGLFFMLVPALGFLFFANSEGAFPFILLSSAIGIPIARSFYNCLPFRLWLAFATLVSGYGMFLIIYWSRTPLEYIGFILLGASAGGVIFVLVPNIITGWFRISKTTLFGWVGCFSVLLGLVFEFILTLKPFAAMAFALLLMTLSSALLLEKPLLINFEESLRETSHVKKSRVKSCLFFLFIAVSAAVVCRIGYMDILYSIGSFPPFPRENPGLAAVHAGMILGPAIVALFTDRKGIYSGCILLLFLSEVSVMSVGFYKSNTFMAYAGAFVFGALLTSAPIICSLLTYYLLGPAGFNQNLCKTIILFPLGFSSLLIMKNIQQVNFDSYPVVVGTLIMLVAGFFTVFSAWKHRLVLLKKP